MEIRKYRLDYPIYHQGYYMVQSLIDGIWVGYAQFETDRERRFFKEVDGAFIQISDLKYAKSI